VEDAAILLDVLTQEEGRYAKSLSGERENWRLGIPRPFFFDDLDPEIASAVEDAINALQCSGCVVVEVDIRVDSDRTLQSAEAYAYHRELIGTCSELYNPETLRRLRTGEGVTDHQYQSALRELAHMREEIAKIFENVDLLVTPTTPIPAPRISELTTSPDLLRPAELLLLRNTRPVNVWGLPAISVPCGLAASGLPIGLQIIGPLHREERVLQLAFAFEQMQRQKYLPA